MLDTFCLAFKIVTLPLLIWDRTAENYSKSEISSCLREIVEALSIFLRTLSSIEFTFLWFLLSSGLDMFWILYSDKSVCANVLGILLTEQTKSELELETISSSFSIAFIVPLVLPSLSKMKTIYSNSQTFDVCGLSKLFEGYKASG